jgi:hypothetical protein
MELFGDHGLPVDDRFFHLNEIIGLKAKSLILQELDNYPSFLLEVDKFEPWSISVEIINREGDFRAGTFVVPGSGDYWQLLANFRTVLRGFPVGKSTLKKDP